MRYNLLKISIFVNVNLPLPMKFFISRSVLYLVTAVFILCVSLTSCRDNITYRIGISQCSNDDWRIKMNEEIEREILMHPEAEVEIRSADDSNEKQIADLHYFAENDFDIIIVAPNEADAITPTITEIYESGTPVVVFDRNVNGNKYTAFQGADNDMIGQLAGRYASNLLKGKGKVIEIYGRKGSTPAVGRHDGFNNELKKYSSIEIADCLYGNWNYEDAYRLADSLYKVYPDVSLVYAHNDRMAIGASEAAKKAGIHPYIIGVDAAPGIGIKAVRDSVINATFLYPTEGHQLIRTALSILKGEPYDTVSIVTIPSPVDLSNADILLMQNESLQEETSKMKDLKKQIDTYWEKHSAQTTLLYVCIALALLFCAVIFIILKAYWQRKKYQERLLRQNELLAEQHKRQKELNEQLNVATQSKLVFFTNVSHDLRTPLTLIADPVAQIAGASNLTSDQKTLMRLADKNVRILRRLINQILDFRKYENGKLNLNLTEVNLGALMVEWAEAFRSVTRQRGIKLVVDIPEDTDLNIAVDVEKMERICYNLLSNAIKYTPGNGTVTLKCRRENDRMLISVSDTGSGIPEADRDKIFDRFYQIDKVRPKGSGIGLSLVKAFVELHNGTISLQSEIGKGTEFTISLPIQHCESVDIHEADPGIPNGIDSKDVEAEIGDIEAPDLEFADDRPLLLIIDDNEDILVLLRTILGNEYNVITASDGKTGLHLAARYTPDAILCDVMMPVMDGMECCRRLKEEISTSHIPVLMLTACSDDEQRASGYDSGADGYMSKPFDNNVLRSRIASLIANRRLIRNIWGNNEQRNEANLSKPHTQSAAKPKKSLDVENEFYAKFIALVEKEMGNPELNVDQLASEMGLGRSQFYRKIKALTNYSPVELLRNMRLKKARHLLSTTDMSISEIGYEVGFSNPAYFSKCYREAFGETPSELRAKL